VSTLPISDASAPAMLNTEHRVRNVLAEYAQLSSDASTINAGNDLYEAGMTSRASVNVMLALEAEFGVEFPDNMLRRDVFESINAMCEAVESLSLLRSA
jgi:acyl carrier protein